MRLWIVSRANTYKRDFVHNVVNTYAFRSEEKMREFVARDFKEKLEWLIGLPTGETVLFASADMAMVEDDPNCTALIATRDAKGEETRVTWCFNAATVDADFSTGERDNEMREKTEGGL